MSKKKSTLKVDFKPKTLDLRVWDKKLKEMIYGDLIGVLESCKSDDQVLMQLVYCVPNFGAPGDWYYIYEGDIVEWFEEREGREPCSPTHRENCIGVVMWNDDDKSFMIKEYYHHPVFGPDTKFTYFPHLTPIKVCGNIFENSNLLKK